MCDHYLIAGTAGDSLSYHKGMQFSTKDRDNDARTAESCAVSFQGAWWYENCYYSNLNGIYLTNTNVKNVKGIRWKTWKDSYPASEDVMRIKPQ